MDCKYAKVYLLIVLVIGIVISMCFYHSTANEDKIHELMEKSNILIRKNDSLVVKNNELDKKIDSIRIEKEILIKEKTLIQIKIEKLNKRRNEVHNYVNHLSANGVANELSNYLDEKSKSGDTIR